MPLDPLRIHAFDGPLLFRVLAMLAIGGAHALSASTSLGDSLGVTSPTVVVAPETPESSSVPTAPSVTPVRHALVSVATTGSAVAWASQAGGTNQPDYWQVVHGGLIAGPATGYATAGRQADAWRGLALRSAIVAGMAVAGAYEPRSRTGGIARRERTILVAGTTAMGLSALWDIGRLPAAMRRAQHAGLAHGATPRGNTALQLSLAGTLVPAVLAFAPDEGGLAVLGIVAGPATGYVYGRRTARGLAGVGIRALGAALVLEPSFGLAGSGWEITEDPLRQSVAATVVLASAAYDLWRVRDVVRPREGAVGVSLEPALVGGSPGLAMNVRF